MMVPPRIHSPRSRTLLPIKPRCLGLSSPYFPSGGRNFIYDINMQLPVGSTSRFSPIQLAYLELSPPCFPSSTNFPYDIDMQLSIGSTSPLCHVKFGCLDAHSPAPFTDTSSRRSCLKLHRVLLMRKGSVMMDI